jgi:type I restriction enzyme S subunit
MLTHIAALGDVAFINPRQETRPGGDTVVSFLRMSDVGTDGTTTPGTDRPFSDVAKGYTQFSQNDVLVAKITPCFENGKIAQATTRHARAAGSTEFHVVRPKANVVDGRYLHYFLRQPIIRLVGEKRMTGSAGQRRVPESYLAELRIPVPPIEEQRKIASMLNEVELLRTMRRQTIGFMSELGESIFSDIFGNGSEPLTTRPLKEVADVASGITKGRKVPSGTPLRTVPYLAVANVQDKRLNLSAVKTIEASESEIERYRLHKDDLLLTEGGDPDKLGRGTLWNNEIPEAIHQNHIFRVRLLNQHHVNPVFLNWYVGSDFGKRYFLRSAKRTTGIASINSTQLKNFPLRLPPIHQQEEFAEKLAEIREVKSLQNTHMHVLDELFDSLQARAFHGEL